MRPDTTYYYKISAANGTTASGVLSFTTARAAGDPTEFTVAVLNDMGYTNAGGTYQQLMQAVSEGVAFAWHGGDIVTRTTGTLVSFIAQTTGPSATTAPPVSSRAAGRSPLERSLTKVARWAAI